MKRQIERLSPHQNGKVFGVLMALTPCIIVLPVSVLFLLLPAGPQGGKPPMFFFLFFPVMYLIFGYAFISIGCRFYNFMFKFIGGFEFEAADKQSGEQ